jgi:hypothetical protein
VDVTRGRWLGPVWTGSQRSATTGTRPSRASCGAWPKAGGTVGSIDSRLRRLEGQGHRCPECGLSPSERGRPVAIYDEEPGKGFRGDTSERCGRCGRSLYTVLRVVYDGEAGGLAP